MGAMRIGADVRDVLRLFESLLGFLSPDEGIRLFEELVEWRPPFAEPRNEAAQGSQATGESLHALDIVYGTYVGDGYDLFGVGFDAVLGYDVPE